MPSKKMGITVTQSGDANTSGDWITIQLVYLTLYMLANFDEIKISINSLHFVSFLQTEVAQVVQMLPHGLQLTECVGQTLYFVEGLVA